jgi:FADH2 O2-dependent halogenase
VPDVDLAIVGSGFGGSLLAMVARRLGLSVLLIERGVHPRFAIGESASPLAGVVLEQLADRYGLARVKPLAAYGPWRRAYPEIACGLKRGFTYFKHQQGARFRRSPDRANELLVSASPNDEVSDTHWFRADVDHFLVREAVDLGVDYVDRVSLDRLDWSADGAPVLSGTREGRPVRVVSRSVVDATGPRGFLSRAIGVESHGFPGSPGTQALYSHFTGVARCEDMPEFASDDRPPHPVDAAALHHVFDDGWMWVLRFENGITSAGVALTDDRAASLGLADGEPAWRRLLADYPSIQAQFADATPVREFTWMPRVSYRADAAVGSRWAMLPSAAAFVDPLFSSGIPLTLLGIERLAGAIESGAFPGGERSAGRGGDRGGLERYERVTFEEADHTARFIAGCYAAFPRFGEFIDYSMLYFAAASHGEMQRRLGRLPPGFLRAHDPDYAASVARLSPAAGGQERLSALVAAAVEPVNVAGLCDRRKRNWYGVDVEDAVRGADRLGATEDEVRAIMMQVAVQSFDSLR